MKLGKKIGRIGFVVGFVGPVLFYVFYTNSMASFACLFCPHITMFGPTRLTWLQIDLGFGLVQGLAFALLGFAIGYAISKIQRPRETSKQAN